MKFVIMVLFLLTVVSCGRESENASEVTLPTEVEVNGTSDELATGRIREPEPVAEPEPPPDLKDLGVCKIGMDIKPGESCSYIANGEKITFWVNPEGLGCRSGTIPEREEIIFGLNVKIEAENVNVCRSPLIEKDDTFQTPFSAKQNDDNSWRILDVP